MANLTRSPEARFTSPLALLLPSICAAPLLSDVSAYGTDWEINVDFVDLYRNVVRSFLNHQTMTKYVSGKEYDMQVLKRALSALFSFLHWKTKVQEPDPFVETPRPMTGFWATLTPEQKKLALEYRGIETHGDERYAR